MSLKSAIGTAWRMVAGAEAEFKRKRALEDTLEEYMKLLLASGLLAAVVSLLWALGNALYYDLFRQVTVQYLRLLNYSASIAAGTFFFYLFAGTMLLGLLSLVLRIFVRMPYTALVRVLCLAAAPVLLFGWISPKVAAALLVWSAALAVIGIREQR